jgi:hypothetical protein
MPQTNETMMPPAIHDLGSATYPIQCMARVQANNMAG